MERLTTAYRGNFLGGIYIKKEAVQNSNVSNKRTISEHYNFRSFCSGFGINHFLNDFDFSLVNILQVYGQKFHHGHYHKIFIVGTYTVSSAWRVIAKTNILEVSSNP